MSADQPDGICTDDMLIPAPAAAAERVHEFVSWFGDGEVWDRTPLGDIDPQDPPLYARDLAALACAALHGYRAEEPSRCLHEPTETTPAVRPLPSAQDVAQIKAEALQEASDALLAATTDRLAAYGDDAHAETARVAIQGCVASLRTMAGRFTGRDDILAPSGEPE